MTALRLGSLFDGIGVFPLAAVRCGIEPVWASEIEKAPISITKRHFPDMAHADRGTFTGPVRKLQSEHPTAGAGADDPKRACHHARRSVHFAAPRAATVLFQEIRFETAPQLSLYGGGRQSEKRL